MNTAETKQLVCIVDDDRTNARILEFVLRNDYDTCVADTGAEALALIREKQPDLVLLDILMPDMDGLDVCEQLKADPATTSIPVVFVTGLEDGSDQEKGFEVGAADYIAKPINAKVVKARIGRILEVSLYVEFLESLLVEKSQASGELRDLIEGVLSR